MSKAYPGRYIESGGDLTILNGLGSNDRPQGITHS